MQCVLNLFRAGVEAKRSFAQSSLPSFLSRKRAGRRGVYFHLKEELQICYTIS